MSNANPELKYFVAPYGILWQEPGDGDRATRVSKRIDRVRDGHNDEVTPLVNDLFENSKNLNTLYGFLSQPEKWQDVSVGDMPAYRVTTDAVDFTVSVRPMPNGMLDNAESYVSRYVLMDFYNRRTDIRSVYGIGFYTDTNGHFTAHTLSLFLVNYVHQLMLELSKKKPDELSKLTEAAYKELSDYAWKKASKAIKKVVPGFVLNGISFALDPSVENAVSIAESVIIGLVPSLVGKILLYVAFEVLNYLFEDDYNIRYAIVNRSTSVAFELEEAYTEYVGKLPDILKDPHDSIMHRAHQTPYYASLDNNDCQWKWVMQTPTFVINNDGGGAPSILIRLKRFQPGTFISEGWPTNNIMSAYDIESFYDNRQGVAIYDEYKSDEAQGIYDYLTREPHYGRYQEKRQPVMITQVTNALSGVDDETYDVVLVIDNYEA